MRNPSPTQNNVFVMKSCHTTSSLLPRVLLMLLWMTSYSSLFRIGYSYRPCSDNARKSQLPPVRRTNHPPQAFVEWKPTRLWDRDNRACPIIILAGMSKWWCIHSTCNKTLKPRALVAGSSGRHCKGNATWTLPHRQTYIYSSGDSGSSADTTTLTYPSCSNRKPSKEVG